MGVFSGSITISKFFVRGAPRRGFKSRYLENIALRAFRPLRPDEDVDERVGWCVAGRLFDLELTDENVFFGPYLLLGLRQDRWKLPPALLQAHYQEALSAMLAKSGRERLTKSEKDAVKAKVVGGLKRKVLPAMRLVDLAWDLDARVLFFWSQSTSMHERLAALFERTFDLQIDVASPFMVASESGLADRQLDDLVRLEPTRLRTS